MNRTLSHGGQGSPEPRLSFAPGEVVADRYLLERTLGAGGMGEVFEATHRITGKKVALKWLRPELAKDDAVRRRLVREAQIAARIQHPNVVDIYDVGTHEGAIFLVMELLRGQTLRDWFVARGPADPNELIAILIPALRGLAAVHAAGFIHRDLKPHNLFLCEAPDGAFLEAKVLDFGIASDGGSLNATQITAPGEVVGTPAYMAPEQLDGREVDHRADVYAVGVILYEGLTGRRPFDATDLGSLVRAIVLDEPVPIRQLRPDIPPELDAIVLRAMARDRAQRHRDVASLAGELARFSTIDPNITPLSLAPPVRPTSRRRLLGWAVAIAVLAFVSYLLLAPLLRVEPAQPYAAPPPIERVQPVPVEVPGEVPLPAPQPNALPSGSDVPVVTEVASAPPASEAPPPVRRVRATNEAPPVAPPAAPTEPAASETPPEPMRPRNRFSLDRESF